MNTGSDIPAGARHILRTLTAAGREAFLVGGCVRDLLRGVPPHDWDICTSARPEETKRCFAGRRILETGARHGTVTVLEDGEPYEITTYRAEGPYSDGRRPDYVAFVSDLETDLARRDFTVNAMALGPAGEVIDPFGGRADLARRAIRCVGDPDRRFAEDALRMLRAVRFAAQLDFSVEPATWAAMGRNARRTERISGERIQAELEKILLSPRPQAAGAVLELGLLAHLWRTPDPLPDLAPLAALPPQPIPRWRGFCRATGFPITALPTRRTLRRAVLHPEEEAVRTLALSGGALAALGLEGPAIGRMQRRLAGHVLDHPEDNRFPRLMELAQGWLRAEGANPP